MPMITCVNTPSATTERAPAHPCTLSAHTVSPLGVLTKLITGILSAQQYMQFRVSRTGNTVRRIGNGADKNAQTFDKCSFAFR